MHFLMTDTLSSAAQVILDAYMKGYGWLDGPCKKDGLGVAAVLRATADQVAPSDAIEPRNYLPAAIECQRIRAELLGIAAELENANE